MLTGAVEVYANHGVLIVGSTSWPELDWGDGPAGSDGHHVAVRTRGQVASTRVCFWSFAMPIVGEVVFDGDLDLPGYTIYVGDIERLSRWTQRIGQTGPQRVVVRVDDPGHASRVHVGLDLGTDVRPVPDTVTPPLMEVLISSPEHLSQPNQRGLILDGHDSPEARLSAAIRVLSAPDLHKPWLEPYEISGIVEWLRWLGTDLTFDRAQVLGAELQRLVQQARRDSGGEITHERANRIAHTIVSQIS